VIVDVDGDGDGDDSPTELRRHGNDAGDELDPTSLSFFLEYRKNLKAVNDRRTLHRGASRAMAACLAASAAPLRPAASAMFNGTESAARRSWSAR